MPDPKTIGDVLRAVDSKLSSTEKWCRGVYAKNLEGDPVPENSDQAVCWCFVGAVVSIAEDVKYPGLANGIGTRTLAFVRKQLRTEYKRASLNPTQWNDMSTFYDVKGFITRTLASGLPELEEA